MTAVASLSEWQTLTEHVLWAVFGVSVAFGWIAQRTHFCTMGALSDIVNMGDWSRMRMWAMAIGVATVAFHAMAGWGWIDPTRSYYTAARVIWLSALVGGVLFGFGMVLASGCGSKTLVRIGGGSLKSLVVMVVMGISALATLRGIVAVVRVRALDAVAFEMPGSSSIAHGLAAAVPWASAAQWGVALGLGLLLWALASPRVWTPHHLLGGLGLGACVAAMWWITGHWAYVPEHPQTLEAVHAATHTGLMESLTFTAPMAYTLEYLGYFSDTSRVLSTGVVSVLGVIAGAWLQALMGKTFRWEGFRSTQDTALHLAGAVLMGMGGVTALGCTVGQGLSGLSTLSLTSLLAFAGIVAGGLAGLKFQTWLVMRD